MESCLWKFADKIVSTKINDDFCDDIGSSAKVTTIEVLPSIDAGADITSCIGDTVALKVKGGNNISWNVLSGSQLQVGVNWFPQVNSTDTNKYAQFIPTQTTVFEVSGKGLKDACGKVFSGCHLIDTVTVYARDSFTVFNVLDTLLCNPATNKISVRNSKPQGVYTYQWTPSEFIDSPSLKEPTLLSLKKSQKFQVKVASSLGCERTGFVNVRFQIHFLIV